MKIFRGPNARSVLPQVRRELGEDALVLETRELKLDDGTRTVEVVAAVDRDAPTTAEPKPAEPTFDDLAFLMTVADSPPDPTAGKDDDDDKLLARLVANEIRPTVARSLVRRARRTRRSNLTATVKELIGRQLGATLPPQTRTPRVLALVGPTGAGKTTTVAKLAARLQDGMGRRVGLVAADPHRVGAFEQLAIYADLLGVPARVAHRPRDIDRALRSLAGCDWIIIDTQGRSPREALADGRWQRYFATSGIDPLLVLAANTRETDLDTAVDAFWGSRPKALVFTKLDETSRLGSIVNQSVRTRLPVALLTNGQNVPEDLILTSRAAMTEMVLRGRAC